MSNNLRRDSPASENQEGIFKGGVESLGIVYVSKYASIPPAQAGLRGLLLLSYFSQRGQSVHLVTSNSNHLNERSIDHGTQEYQVPITILPAPRYFRGESLRRLISWIVFDSQVALMRFPKGFRPDIVIASSPSILTLLSGFILAQRHRAAFIVEIRDIWPLTAVEEFDFSSKHPLVRVASVIEKVSYSVADAVVGTMPNLRAHLDELGLQHKTVAAIGLGIDRQISVGEIPQPIDRDRSSLVVGYAGSIGKSNALHLLLETAEQLVDEPRIRFRLAGDGDLRMSLEDRFGDSPNIEFLGRIRKDEVPRFLSECDVLYFAIPDTKIGKFGQSLNKVLEYMLAARPIVGSFSGFQSMVNEADCGWFVPSESPDELRALFLSLAGQDRKLLDELGARGFEWVTHNRPYSVLGAAYLELVSKVRSEQLSRRGKARRRANRSAA